MFRITAALLLWSAAALCSTALAQRAADPAGSQTGAPGDVARADALFERGRERLAAGAYAEACPLLAESYQFDPATGSLLALAVCHERAGDRARALAAYREVALRAKAEDRPDRERVALDKVAQLEAELPAPAPGSAPLEPASDVPADAASEILQSGPIAKARIPPPVSAAPRGPRSQPRRDVPSGLGRSATEWVGIASLGVGGAGMLVSLALLLRAQHQDQRASFHCPQGVCDDAGDAARSAARDARDAATVTALSGLGAAAAGLVLYVWGRSHHRAASRAAALPWMTATAGGGAVSGRF